MSTTDQMLAESRKKSMLQYVYEGADVADLEAAGYTPDEISLLQPDKSIQPVTPTGKLESYTPTTRDTLRENVRRGVSALGVGDQTAQFYAGRMAGTGGDMGLVDVTGLGVIPQVQEGIQQAERGYKTGSKTEMAMGALGAGLGVLSAIPGGKLLAKSITKGAEKAVEKVLSREVVPEIAQTTKATLAKEVAQTTPKPPYKPAMFRSNEAGKIEVNPNSLMEFYSPTVETIRNVEFPAKGYKGSELLKFLKEKAPGVRKTEVDALDLKLDPQKRYTREEALAEVEKKAYKVYAEEVDDTVYKSQQRQDISDPEISFSTIKINATREGDTFMPSLGYTHYDPETIAHTRTSIRENDQGKRYLLVEELQSDLVQAKGAKPRGALTRDEAYEEVIDSTVKNLASKNPEKLAVYKNNKELYNSMFKLASEDARIRDLQFRGIDVPKGELDNLEKIRNDTISYQNKGGSDSQLLSDFESLGGDAGPTMDRRMKAITKAPLTEDADAVRLALQTAMAKADESDATSIVIPNLQRIVTAQGRGARYGTKNYDKYMKAGSGFQKTYVDGVESFITQLKKEYGDAIKIEQIELPYKSKTTFYSDAMSGRDVPLDNTALRIDFSGLKGVNLKSGQFAEGGSVEKEQMDKLMQEGGIAGSDVTQEPVTGNEVPPGAMPSEVRDDVSAQLSEGEYVVPADVVRFFGVKFFEDLRSQAKQGLSQMQSDGRIGGASVDENGVPAEEDDQLTPEEEQMLNNALGGSTGMAVGGDVVPFDRTKFTLDETTGMETRKYIDPTTGVTQDFQFMDGIPNSTIPANFVPWTQALADSAGKPKAPVAGGTVGGGVGTVGGSGGGADSKSGVYQPTGGTTPVAGAGTGVGGGFNYDKWAEKNYADITSNPYQFGVDALTDTTGKFGSKVASGAGLLASATPLGVPLLIGGMGTKAFNKIENIAGANASLKIMEAQGLQSSTEYSNLKKLTDAAINDLPGLQRAAVKNGLLATGTEYAEPVIKKLKGGVVTPTAPVASAKDKAEKTPTNIVSSGNAELDRRIAAGDPKAIANQQAAARYAAQSGQPVPAHLQQHLPGGSLSGSGSNKPDPVRAAPVKVEPKTQVTPTPTKSIAASPTSYSGYTSAGTSTSSTSSSGPKKGAAGRATGGLVTKDTKTAHKTKGLAGKQ